MKKALIKISMLALLLTAVGCATPAKVSNMTHFSSSNVWAKPTSKFNNAITVEEVTGGEGTNPFWVSKVSSEDFKASLEASLKHAGYLAIEPGPYMLRAELLRLTQPAAGFNLTVTALVNYVFTERASGHVALRETIETPYKAKFGDSLDAKTRLRLANEGAIRSNIQKLLDVLTRNGSDQPL